MSETFETAGSRCRKRFQIMAAVNGLVQRDFVRLVFGYTRPIDAEKGGTMKGASVDSGIGFVSGIRYERPVNDGIEAAIVRVIEEMQNNLSEPFTIDDMARTAMFSKFHFTRIFERVTGVSPRRFLSALRLQEAKKLLLATSLSVTEITHQVGFSSVGTFSTRFKESVGMSPREYRRLGGYAQTIAADPGQRFRGTGKPTCVNGAVHPPVDHAAVGPVFIGLFREVIPQGAPVSCAVTSCPGRYWLTDVPPGTWHLFAHAVPVGPAQDAGVGGSVSPRLLVGQQGPISVRSGTGMIKTDLQLRYKRITDPPVLLAPRDLRSDALSCRR